jgi:hypothetical protein
MVNNGAHNMPTIIEPQDATAENIKQLNLDEIALLIARSWKNVSPYAQPYLEAMFCIKTMDDMYFADNAHYIVTYFLCNMEGYRGDVARLVKAELRARCKAWEKAQKAKRK